MLTLRRALADLLSVFGTAGRLLAAHWPQLIGLFLAGWAARMGFLWLAVVVSAVSPTVAVLLLPLAPLSTLLSLILMLRVVAESLPAFADLFRGPAVEHPWRNNLAAAAMVLLPFLALYASQGLLKDDSMLFLWDARADVLMNQSVWAVQARSDYASGPVLIAMIVVALVLRKVLSVLELPKKSVAWSFAATYLEALWLVTLAASMAGIIEDFRGWVATRKVVAPIVDLWGQFVAAAAQIAIVKHVIDGIGGFIAAAGDMVVIPVAWLAIGAAVYSAKLAGPEFEGHEAVTKRLAKVPSPIKRAVGQVVEPITTPVKDAAAAVGKIAVAGVVPMVLFCVIFVLTAQLKVGVAWLFREVVGSRHPFELYALQPYSILAQRLVYFVVALTLVAAAVNRIVLGQRSQPSADAVPAPAPATA